MLYWIVIAAIIATIAYLVYTHYSSPTGSITFGDLTVTKIPGSS